MKFNISINQKAIIENSKNLDLLDAAILDYLICFCSVDNKKIKQMDFTQEDGRVYRYTWINFKKIIEEMPLLKIKTKPAIGKRIEKLEKNGFIKTILSPDRSLYVRLTEKISVLFFGEDYNSKITRVLSQDNRGVIVGLQHNNNTNNNNTNNNNPPLTPPKGGVGEITSLLKENFSFETWVKWLQSSPQRHIQIIGEFAEETQPDIRTYEQGEEFIARHCKAARKVSKFSPEQITAAWKKIKSLPIEKPTLETVYKFLT